MVPVTLISVNDEWLTVREVAQRLRRSEPTVRRAIWRGALVAHQFGERDYSVAPSDLELFIAKSRTDCADAADRVAGTEDLAKARVVV